jgi:hypothetical protein
MKQAKKRCAPVEYDGAGRGRSDRGMLAKSPIAKQLTEVVWK